MDVVVVFGVVSTMSVQPTATVPRFQGVWGPTPAVGAFSSGFSSGFN